MRRALLIFLFCVANCGLFAAAGCARHSRPPAPGCARHSRPPAPGVKTPARTRIVGEVAVVDEERRFVLIDLQSYLYVPLPGTELRSINAAGETAHLKASPEQKRPFIAADIVDGSPAVGDEVRQ